MIKRKLICGVAAIFFPLLAAAETDNNVRIVDELTRAAEESSWHSVTSKASVSPVKEWIPGEKITESLNPVKTRVRTNAPGKIKYGDMVSHDENKSYNRVESQIMRLFNNGGNDSIKGIYSNEICVLVKIDESAGTVRIPVQTVFRHDTYGPVSIAPLTITESGMTYSKTSDIEGTIDSNGNISLPAWCIVVTDGTYAGRAFGFYTSSRFMPANANVKVTMTDNSVINAVAHIEQTGENELMLYNFAGVGSPVKARITASRQVKVEPQYISTLTQYGDFYVYSADWSTNKVNLSTALAGNGTDNMLTFGEWIVGTNHNCNTVAIKASKSQMTLNSGVISYPAAPQALTGSGSEFSPYLIKSYKDLVAFSENVQNGESYQGKYIRLDADIDMSNQSISFSPIGDLLNVFEGNFDGNNHTISGLAINGYGSGNTGLFGYTGTNSTVRNVNVKNASLYGKGHYLGTIAGTSYGLIDNCHVTGSLSGEAIFMGGITANAWGYVTNCTFNGIISTIGIGGGIAGTSFSHVENCHVDAALTVTGYLDSYYHDVAGISGVAVPGKGLDGLITGCSFAGTLSDTGGYGYCAGIVSKAMNMKIEKCYNVGAISAIRKNSEVDTYAGGIVAWSNSNNIKDCFNAGTLAKSGLSSPGVGGIVGYFSIGYSLMGEISVTDKSFLTNCYNSGQITSSSNKGHKGIYGDIYIKDGYGADPTDGFFTNCYNDFQATGLRDDRFNIGNEELTSTSLPKGFDNSIWKTEAGRYPMLKACKDGKYEDLASSALILSGTETVIKVKNPLTLSSPESIDWSLYVNNSYVKESTGMKINGNKIELKDTYSNDILAAKADEGHIKIYRLSSIPNLFEGEGTAEVPYLIKNEQDLIGLDKAISTYGQSHEGDFFRMTNDIDLNYSQDFSGIGVGVTTEFKGNFDGGNHYIHRLRIHAVTMDASGLAQTAGAKPYAGFFSRIGAEGSIRNLRIADDCDFIYYQNSGGVAGTSKGTIDNCRNYAEIKGVDFYVGGIVGQLEVGGLVSNCYNSGKVIAGGYGAGGIVGRVMGSKLGTSTVENCQNDGPVSADHYNDLRIKLIHREAGGIAGYSYGTVRNCVNQGHIKALHTAGGIVGVNSSNYGFGDVISCLSTGTVNVVNQDEKRGGISGTTTLSGIRANTYYDRNIVTYGAFANSAAEGVTPLSTASLTSGVELNGLSADLWSFEKGSYPVLKQFEEEPASAALRSTYILLAENTSVLDVAAETPVKSVKDSKWNLRLAKHFSLGSDVVKVALPSDSLVVVDTLTASFGKSYKEYALQSIKQMFAGSGSKDDPYKIEKREDLINLSTLVSVTGNDFIGRYFKVINDIDCGEENFTPVAMGIRKFQADFNGNGKSIKFAYTETNTSLGTYAGMFANIGDNGFIHDLKVNANVAAVKYVGGLAGRVYGRISDCEVSGTVKGSNTYTAGVIGQLCPGGVVSNTVNKSFVTSTSTYLAGIVAQIDRNGVVENCENNGTLTGGGNYLGGIAARCNGRIIGSVNKGELTGKAYMGGIVSALDTAAILENCVNYSDINADGTQGGGIAASSNLKSNGYIYGCVNYGNIFAKTYAAGVISRARSGFTVDSCFNYGNVTSNGNYAGGVIGDIDGETGYVAHAIRSANFGSVKGGEQYTGGFSGRISSNSELEHCYSIGSVTAVKAGTNKTYLAGGFAGFSTGDVINCWSSGNVDAEGYGTGGFIGYLSSAKVDRCFSLGNVKSAGVARDGSYANAGGFVGYSSNSEISNVYCTGDVEAPGYCTGLIGALFSGNKLNNAYTLSRVIPSDKTNVGAALIYTSTASDANSTINNVYYLNTLGNTLSSLDQSRATAVDEAGMIQAKLGEAFHISRGAFPVIAGIEEDALAHYHAASPEFFTTTDNSDKLTDNLYIGNHGKEQWSSSEHFEIRDGVAYPVKLGQGVLTLTHPDGMTKREFKFNVTKISGIGSIEADRKIVSKQYFDLQGRKVVHPVKGSVYLIQTGYDDGSFTVTKAMAN